MKRKEIIKAIFGVEVNSDYSLKFIKINSEEFEIELTAHDTFSALVLINYGEVFNSEGETICEVSELEKFHEFNLFNVCPDCEGMGYYDDFIICNRPASACCGGCTTRVECDCENKPVKSC